MSAKYLLILVFAYLIFLSGMCFVGLGKLASLVLSDGWWKLTKDFVSILASLATTFGLPWAIWLYFKQRDKDRLDLKREHDERLHNELRGLMNELTVVLVPDKLIENQIVINSLLYRIKSYEASSNGDVLNGFDFALRTHINQLLNNIQPHHLIKDYSETAVTFLTTNLELNELEKSNQESVLNLARLVVNSNSYELFKFGSYEHISLDKGFGVGLLSKLILIAQPICLGNYTNSIQDESWNVKKLKELFHVLPLTVAAYIYLAYSEDGNLLVKDLVKHER